MKSFKIVLIVVVVINILIVSFIQKQNGCYIDATRTRRRERGDNPFKRTIRSHEPKGAGFRRRLLRPKGTRTLRGYG